MLPLSNLPYLSPMIRHSLSLGPTATNCRCFQEDANAAVDLVYKSNNIYSPPAALSSATASNVLKYIDACRVGLSCLVPVG